MKTRLKDITTQYSKFDTNQVLTEHQLNEFLDYFDDQDRLTRTGLSGVGVVCGFKIVYNNNEKSITISQGKGVTTDGDLLSLQNPSTTVEGLNNSVLKSIDLTAKTYRYFRAYTDGNVKYKPFLDSDSEQIELWELHENNGDSNADLATFVDLKNMVVVLYLEHYSKTGDLCTQLTCDNQGIEQVAKVRVLLVSEENAKYLVDQDVIYNRHNWQESYLALPEINAKRVILNSNNTENFIALKQNYFEAIKNNGTLVNLKSGFGLMFSKFGKPSIAVAIERLFNFSANAVPTDYQYRYGVLKDLIAVYNEIKALLLHINVECCPFIGAFPKHLMLGRLEEVKPYLSLRHRFYKSPIIGEQDENYKKVISLLQNAIEISSNYAHFDKGETVKITPSQAYGTIGNKAIPFYYKVEQPLLEHWDFEKTRNLRSQYNLSYHKDYLANVPSIREPLDYNIDQANFYRIEGHQGKMYKDALDHVLRLKENKGLNFDVKALSINTTTQHIDLNDYKCQFEDLSILLSAWRTEQNCVLSEMSRFFSAFSTVDVGANVVAIQKGLQLDANLSALNTPVDFDAPDLLNTSGMNAVTAKLDKTTAFNARSNTDFQFRNVGFTQQNELVKVNVVKEQLTTQENTLGALLDVAITDNKEGSANDIMAALNIKTAEVLATDIWVEEAPLGEFIFTNVAETLVHSYILDNRIPMQIIEIDASTLTNYKLTIDALCERVKSLQSKYQTTTVKEGSKQILGLLINQLSTVCCSGKKLEILLEEIEKRKQDILTQIQLSEFVKKHPGLEHKAGVAPGGTFVMAYLTENAIDKPTYEPVVLELDFVKQPAIENLEDSEFVSDRGELVLLKNRLSTPFIFLKEIGRTTPSLMDDVEVLSDDFLMQKSSQTELDTVVIIGDSIEETVHNFSLFLNNKWQRAGENTITAKANRKKLTIVIEDKIVRKNENYIQFENPEIVGTAEKIPFEENAIIAGNLTTKNTVIADFALPYMCCSGCTPINFIVPKDPISLSLPKAFVCLKDDVDLSVLLFKVSPANGEIKAKVPEAIASGITTNELGETVFDAALTDQSLYGTEILFTVNDEDTDCKVTVYPDPNISVNTPQVVYNTGKTIATVTYTVVAALPNINYTWDFGKNVLSNQIPNSNGEVVVTYNLPFNSENTITPSLTISNGFCESSINIEAISFDAPLDISLEIQESYCLNLEDETLVRLDFNNKMPVEAPIEIVDGPFLGVTIEGNQLVINPQLFDAANFDVAINFTVLGLPTNAIIKIHELINASIMQESGALFWDAGELINKYRFEAIIPDSVNASQLNYTWHINGGMVGDTKVINHHFVVQPGQNNFEIELQIAEENGCASQTQAAVIINYPNFSFQLPENKLEYCLNDDTAYPINILPTNIENTIPEGLGVVLRLGKHVFVPKAVNAIQAGTTTLGLAGQTLLTVVLKAGSNASFTWTIENGVLTIKNNSEIGTGYIWNVGGNKIERNTRTSVVLDVINFEMTVIDISLTVISDCGSDTVTEKNVQLKQECIPLTATTIENETSILIEAEVNIDVSNTINELIVTPTIDFYKTVNKNPEAFLTGNKNEELVPLSNLITETANAMIQDSNLIAFLPVFYNAQIRLVFNILHCQSHDILEENKNEILTVFSKIKESLNLLVEQDVNVDPESELENYLIAYSNELGIIEYIKMFLQNELIPLIK